MTGKQLLLVTCLFSLLGLAIADGIVHITVLY